LPGAAVLPLPSEKVSLHSIFRRQISAPMLIDKVNVWGFLAVPLGVLICFGPGLFVWLKEEYKTSPSEKHEEPPVKE